MKDYFKENPEAFHSYLFSGVKYNHAIAWRDSLPANRRNSFAVEVNRFNDRKVL